MAENTLSPVGFDRPFVKAHVPHESRFALACFAGKHRTTEADTVRHVLAVGLERLGWTEERIIAEYAAYRLRCLREGTINEFEGR